MKSSQTRQWQVKKRISVYNEERFIQLQLLFRVEKSPACPERLILDGIDNLGIAKLSADAADNHLRLIADRQNKSIDPLRNPVVHLMLKERTSADGRKRLWQIWHLGTETRAFPACQNNRLHSRDPSIHRVDEIANLVDLF